MYFAIVGWRVVDIPDRSCFVMLFRSCTPLLIFYLVLSIVESGVKFSVIVKLSLFPFNSFNICFTYLGALFLHTYILSLLYHFKGLALCHITTFFISYTIFVLTSVLPKISIATIQFSLNYLCMGVSFYSFTFNSFVFLNQKCVSCNQCVVRSCFIIHCSNLYFLIGEFIPFI